jgi:hypothetical protein
MEAAALVIEITIQRGFWATAASGSSRSSAKTTLDRYFVISVFRCGPSHRGQVPG